MEDGRVKYMSLIANFAHLNQWSVWDAIDEDLVCTFGTHPVGSAKQTGKFVHLEDELRH